MDPPILATADSTVEATGRLDCKRAPRVRITAAASGIFGTNSLANLAQGWTMIHNATGTGINVFASGNVAAAFVLRNNYFITVYRSGDDVFVQQLDMGL